MEQERPTPPNKLIRLHDVLAMLSISDQTLNRWIKAGKFPAPHWFGSRVRMWKVEDVDAWFEAVGQHDTTRAA